MLSRSTRLDKPIVVGGRKIWYTINIFMKLDEKTQAQKQLGEKLKEAREKMNFTQAEVAEKTDMTVTYYAMIERGEVNLTFDKFRKLFKLLKVKTSEIPL